MVLLFFVVAVLFSLGAVAVAKVAQLAMRKLDLELFSVLEWLGLAETPVDELTARRTGRATPAYRRAKTAIPSSDPT